MNKIYQAKVIKTGAGGETTIRKSTSVYADDDLTAKVAAAEQLGVTPDEVIVEQIPNVFNPTDADMKAMQDEAIENLGAAVAGQDQMTTGGGAYGS